jgi:mono/diheme cytochrome c family protein
MTRRRFALIFVAISLSLMLIVPTLSPADEAMNLYREKCANCHGADGAGKTDAARKMGSTDLRSKQVQTLTDEQLYKTIAEGEQHKNYPHAYLYKGISEQQIKGLVTLIRKFK